MNIFLAVTGIIFLVVGFYSLNSSESSWPMIVSLLLGVVGVIAGSSIVSIILLAFKPNGVDATYVIAGVQLILAFIVWTYFSRINNRSSHL